MKRLAPFWPLVLFLIPTLATAVVADEGEDDLLGGPIQGPVKPGPVKPGPIKPPGHGPKPPGGCDGKGGQSGVPVQIQVNIPPSIEVCSPFSMSASIYDACGFVIESFNEPAKIRDTSNALVITDGAKFENGHLKLEGIVMPHPAKYSQIEVLSGGAKGLSPAFESKGSGPVAGIELVAPERDVDACTYFPVVATARDQCGNRVVSFQSTAQWEDTSGRLRLAGPAPFVNGQAKTNVRIDQPYTQDRIIVKAEEFKAETGYFDVVKYGHLHHLRFDEIPATVVKNRWLSLKAYAEDACGNVVENFDSPATWSDLSGGLRPKEPCDFHNGRTKTMLALFKKKFQGNRVTLQAGGKEVTSNTFDVVRGFWPWEKRAPGNKGQEPEKPKVP